MFGDSLDLADVMRKLKRADDALTEFVAPLWPGVERAAVWIGGRPQLFRLAQAVEHVGYYVLATADGQATVLRAADAAEITRYRELLEKASVILLEPDLAFPASFAERLQGITSPRPIYFVDAKPLQQVMARFDGINLFFDCVPHGDKSSPFGGLFGESSIFTPGELLGIPGEESSGSGAQQAQEALRKHPDLHTEYQLRAVLEPAGAVLEDWSRVGEAITLQWRHLDADHQVTVPSAASPITSGICLPGARGFDPAALTRLLIEHALDSWQ